MKKILFIALVLLSAFAQAQVPQGINYQAVARDASGNLVVSQPISVRFTIGNTIAIDPTTVATYNYQETHTVTTSSLGLFNLKIGSGAPTGGSTFTANDWQSNQQHLLVEVDFTGGTAFTIVGSNNAIPFQSVPYALLAENVVNNNDADADPNNELVTTFSVNGANLELIDAGNTFSVPLSSIVTPGSDDQNIDSLRLNGTILTAYIEGGGSANVDLSSLQDGTGTDSQTLSISANTLTITGGNNVTLPTELPASAVNNQVLTWNGSAWVAQNAASGADNWGSQAVLTAGSNISGDGTFGNELSFSEVDADPTNEYNTSMSVAAGNLIVTDGGGNISVPIISLQDGTGTDDQDILNLGISGNSLTVGIENGTAMSTNLTTNTPSATAGEVMTWSGSSWVAQLPTSITDTDDQVIDTLSLNGTDLWLSLQDDGQPKHVLDLSPISDRIVNIASGTGINVVGTYPNFTVNSIGSTLPASGNLGEVIKWNGSAWVAMNDSVFDGDSSVTNELITNMSFTSPNLTITEGGANTTVDLSALQTSDHDWYEVGGSSAPDNITDDIFTLGKVGVGINNPSEMLDVLSTDSDIDLTTIGATQSSSIHLKKANGTILSPTNVGDGDDLGGYAFMGKFGGGYYYGARIGAVVNGMPGANYMPADLEFSTSANAGNPYGQLRMVIKADGKVGIGTSTPGTLLDVAGRTRTDQLVVLDNTNSNLNVIGSVLTNDGNGYARWEVPAGGTGQTWDILGNSGTSPTVNFVGTTDNQPLVFKVNNVEKLRLETNGTLTTLNTGGSVLIGDGAGVSDDLTNNQNIFIGYNAGNSMTTGFHNVAIGRQALESASNENYNTAVGAYSMQNNSGTGNTAVGVETLMSNTSLSNTAIGAYSLKNNSSGYNNTALGYHSSNLNTSGNSNTSIGHYSARATTTGNKNVAVGTGALQFTTIGSNNISLGYRALYTNKGKSGSIAIGYQAMFNANNSTSTGSTYNIAMGYEALRGSASAVTNTGTKNIALGYRALYRNTGGESNVAIGHIALNYNSTGDLNTAVGTKSMEKMTSGTSNTAIGALSLNKTTIGDGNTVVGYNSLYSNISGINNTCVGANSFNSTTVASNSSAFGRATLITGSNQIHLGNSAITEVKAQVGFTTYSDGRIKDNITEDVIGLDFITRLKPVTYNFNIDRQNKLMGVVDDSEYPEKYDLEKIKMTGFIAQDVERAANESGFAFSGVKIPKTENELYGLTYSEFVVPLVKAVQEQQEMILELKKEIEELKKNK